MKLSIPYDKSMSRTFQTDAIVLRTFRVGDIHKGVTFLSSDSGLVDAVAYGAYKGKGKLGGSTDPFTWGHFYCYRDPVRGRTKINDIESYSIFEAIRGDLSRFYIACYWAELILASFGAGGESLLLFPLLLEALTRLDTMQSEDRWHVFIQFGWRFLGLLGVRSEVEECASCGHVATEGEGVFLDTLARGFLCGHCKGASDLPLGPGGVRYLRFTEAIPFEKAVKVHTDLQTERQLTKILRRVLGEALDQPLKTAELL
jgi:DNA repair protein RecO (recombination protein O)